MVPRQSLDSRSQFFFHSVFVFEIGFILLFQML